MIGRERTDEEGGRGRMKREGEREEGTGREKREGRRECPREGEERRKRKRRGNREKEEKWGREKKERMRVKRKGGEEGEREGGTERRRGREVIWDNLSAVKDYLLFSAPVRVGYDGEDARFGVWTDGMWISGVLQQFVLVPSVLRSRQLLIVPHLYG